MLASPGKGAYVLPKLGTYQGKLWNANCSFSREQIYGLEGCTVLKITSSYTLNHHLSVHDDRFHEVTLKDWENRSFWWAWFPWPLEGGKNRFTADQRRKHWIFGAEIKAWVLLFQKVSYIFLCGSKSGMKTKESKSSTACPWPYLWIARGERKLHRVSYSLLEISHTDIALFAEGSPEQQPSENKGLGMEACPFQENWPFQR